MDEEAEDWMLGTEGTAQTKRGVFFQGNDQSFARKQTIELGSSMKIAEFLATLLVF